MKGSSVALTLAVALLFAGGSLGIYAAVMNSVTLKNTGTIKSVGVGVYWDSACTSKVSSIEWGILEPGAAKSVTTYIRNEGNAPITLMLNVTNWSPSNASNYLSLSWSYSGAQINPGNFTQVAFTLNVSISVTALTNFSFDIVITSTG